MMISLYRSDSAFILPVDGLREVIITNNPFIGLKGGQIGQMNGYITQLSHVFGGDLLQ